jgi:hypothetical protein
MPSYTPICHDITIDVGGDILEVSKHPKIGQAIDLYCKLILEHLDPIDPLLSGWAKLVVGCIPSKKFLEVFRPARTLIDPTGKYAAGHEVDLSDEAQSVLQSAVFEGIKGIRNPTSHFSFVITEIMAPLGSLSQHQKLALMALPLPQVKPSTAEA